MPEKIYTIGMTQQRYQQIQWVTLVGAVANIFLALLKIFFGYLGNSHALVADGVHSFSDLLTDLLVIVAAKFANAGSDDEHPYGHARIETAASLGLALFLMLVAAWIIIDAAQHFWHHSVAIKPSVFVLWVAFFSVIINELVYRYTHYVGRKISSDLLIANALHSRSDAAASLVVLVGVLGSLCGLVYFDQIAAIIVGFLIAHMAWRIGWENIRELIDTGLPAAEVAELREIISQVSGVRAIHELRTRRMAHRVLLDVHIIVDPFITVSEGHYIADKVVQVLQQKIGIVDGVVVHTDAENDEMIVATQPLLSRTELLPLLQTAWHSLPGADEISEIRLHYLNAKLQIEVGLPIALLAEANSIALQSRYAEAALAIPQVSQVRLFFV